MIAAKTVVTPLMRSTRRTYMHIHPNARPKKLGIKQRRVNHLVILLKMPVEHFVSTTKNETSMNE